MILNQRPVAQRDSVKEVGRLCSRLQAQHTHERFRPSRANLRRLEPRRGSLTQRAGNAASSIKRAAYTAGFNLTRIKGDETAAKYVSLDSRNHPSCRVDFRVEFPELPEATGRQSEKNMTRAVAFMMHFNGRLKDRTPNVDWVICVDNKSDEPIDVIT